MATTQAASRKLARYLLAVVLVASATLPLLYSALHSTADELKIRALTIQDSQAGDTTRYTVSFTINTSATVGSVKLSFCSNSPAVELSCDPPNGMDAAQAVLVAQSGLGGLAITSATANELTLSGAPTVVTPPLAVSLSFAGIANPSDIGSYFGRIQTFSSTDASGPYVDYGGLAFATTTNLQISTQVPPYLMFCSGLVIQNLDCAQTTGDYINFGELSTLQPRYGQSQLLAATNAASGYGITVAGTTLTSGNNVITAISLPDISRPGTAQFGINLRANADPAIGVDPAGPGAGSPLAAYATPNKYVFVPGDTIATTVRPDLNRQYTVSYLVNVPKGQAAGVYVSTLTYICLANF